jgi:hypothetical protein
MYILNEEAILDLGNSIFLSLTCSFLSYSFPQFILNSRITGLLNKYPILEIEMYL